jgi:hypothetical protein
MSRQSKQKQLMHKGGVGKMPVSASLPAIRIDRWPRD